MRITDGGVMGNLIEFLQHDSENPLDIKKLCFSIIPIFASTATKIKNYSDKKEELI